MSLTLYTHLITAKTANYVAQTSDGVIYTDGATQVTLFSANGKQGHEISIKNMAVVDCNVITSNSELIDANSSWNLTQYGTLTIVSDGVKWTRLPVGGGGTGLSNSDATTLNGKTEAQLNVNSALTANNATYAYGKTEGNLNVNSALVANNATYAFGKTEGALNVNSALSANTANDALYANSANSALTANNSTYAFGKSESGLNVNSALTANVANNSTYAFGKTEGALNVNSALSANTANDASYLGGKPEANLHVNTALTSNNSTYAYGKSEGNLNVNSALSSNTANSALSANNSAYLNGHTEAQLNANSALSANNSAYLNGHTEAQLNANSALTANNATYAFGKAEGSLNVNSALSANTANNATYAFGKSEGNLNVNSALVANNSTYAFGKAEANLNVNSALTANVANNATYAFGKTEGALNVNSALSANVANDTTYAYGKTEGALNVNSAVSANTANTANTANDASYLGGQLPAFYTNASNANTGTLPDARLSANVVRYATAQTQNYVLAAPASANGNITFRALTSNDVTNLDERIQDMNIYGFAELGDAETTIAFDANTYTFTLANTSSATWHFFVQGTWYAAAGPRTATLSGTPPANGVYYIYLDGTTGANANLVTNTVPWTLSENDGILPVAVIRWSSDANSNPRYFMADERHTCAMSRTMHRYLHTTRGAQLISGGTLTGQTFASNTNAALTFSIANTVIMDEDITHTIPGLADGNGAANAYIIAFRSNTTNWIWEQSEVPFRYTAPAGYIQYDANGTMTQGQSAKFYTSYILATSFYKGPGGNTGLLIVPGRGEFASQAAAEAENPANFDWTGLSIAEGIIIWRCVWESKNNFGTKGLVELMNLQRVSVAVTSATVGSAVTDHNSLSGLQGGGAGEYYHVTAAQWANGSLTANVANNATYAFGKSEGDLNVNSALNANQANSATYPAGLVAVKGDLIIGNATPAWARLPAGANGYVLTINDNVVTWNAVTANGVSAHTLLQSDVHTDTTNGTVTRGDVITAMGATPKWTRLPIGANTYVLTSNGTEAVWAAPSANVVTENANNAYYLNGKAEGDLNVNSALHANNATYAFGKAEGSLNVNNALTANLANDTTYAFGKTEGALNVNSAVSANTANNSTYAFGKTEGSLNVNSALSANVANNATYAFGKSEGNLNVNSALLANNADFLDGAHQADLNVNSALSSNNSAYLNGHTEAQLNVNSALVANNSTYAFGKSEGDLNVNSALTANQANSASFASNADLLDGQHGSYYTNASNMDSGTLPAGRLSGGYGNVTHVGVLDELYFNTAPANTTADVGKLVWNPTDLTLNLGLNTNTTLQIGQETLIKVLNKSGVLVGDGNVVYCTGAHDFRPTINLVLANAHGTATTLGVVTGDIANNQEGFVTVRGLVRGIDTTGGAEAWANGDVIYTSKTTPGKLTNVLPVAPHHQDRVGIVVRAHSSGDILVNIHPHNMFDADEHGDVTGYPNANNQVPVWNTAVGTFSFKIPPEAINANTANNATYAYGKSEGNLNVNSAVTANSANTANSASTANNATYAFGKSEGNLNVNAATRLSTLASLSTVYAGPVNSGALYGTTDFSGLGDQNPYVTSDYDTIATWDKGRILSGAWLQSTAYGALITANTVGANQFSQITLKDTADSTAYYAGPAVHITSTGGGNFTGYILGFNAGGGAGAYTQMKLYRVASYPSAPGGADLATYDANVVAGDTVKLRIAGTTLTVSINDVDLGNTVVDGNYTTGKPAIINYFFGSPSINSFTWGEGTGVVTSALPTFRALQLSDLPAGIPANTALTANNATYAFGKSEGNLNVNSALSANVANNASYLNTHTEAQLNVNSAVTANNTTYAFGKSEGDLNVNSALTANNATYAFGKSEAGLNVNSALNANNSGYLNGHTEAQLNVNNAVTSNTANSALTANDTLHLRTFDVSANTPANAQVLTWDADANTWYPQTPSGGPGGATYAEDLLGTKINASVTNSSLQTLGTLVALQVNTMLYVNATNVGIGTSPNGAIELFGSSIILGTNTRNDTLHANATIGTYVKGHGVGIGLQPNISFNTHIWFTNTGAMRIAQTGILFYNYEDLEAAFAANNTMTPNGVINAFTYTGTSNNALYLGGVVPSTGTILVGNTSNGWSGLAIGANTYVLTSNGTTASWQAASGGPSTPTLYAAGNSGTSKTLDWNNGSQQYLTMTGNCTLTLNNPADGGRYVILVNSGAGNFLITWPANVKWGPGGAPLNTQQASKVDMFTAIYANTTNAYYMSYSLNY